MGRDAHDARPRPRTPARRRGGPRDEQDDRHGPRRTTRRGCPTSTCLVGPPRLLGARDRATRSASLSDRGRRSTSRSRRAVDEDPGRQTEGPRRHVRLGAKRAARVRVVRAGSGGWQRRRCATKSRWSCCGVLETSPTSGRPRKRCSPARGSRSSQSTGMRRGGCLRARRPRPVTPPAGQDPRPADRRRGRAQRPHHRPLRQRLRDHRQRHRPSHALGRPSRNRLTVSLRARSRPGRARPRSSTWRNRAWRPRRRRVGGARLCHLKRSRALDDRRTGASAAGRRQGGVPARLP